MAMSPMHSSNDLRTELHEGADIYLFFATWGKAGVELSGLVVPVPTDFVEKYRTEAFVVTTHGPPRLVGTRCSTGDVTASTQMLRHIGRTAKSGIFFARDNGFEGLDFGLAPEGFRLDGTDCPRSLALDAEQGAIYVR